MKHLTLFTIFSIILGVTSHAQFGRLLDKAKSKTQQRVDQRVDKEMDKALDKAEGKETKSNDNTSSSSSSKEEKSAKSEEVTLKTFSKFDFIPGDSIIYAEDFGQDAIGELPTNWNTSGTGEVEQIEKYPGQWLRMHKEFIYLSGNRKQFGENYTVEFDLILNLKNNGWLFPSIKFGLFNSNEEDPGDNKFLRGFKQHAAVMAVIYPADYGNSKIQLHSFKDNADYFMGSSKACEYIEKYYGKPIHVAIQVQKERLRMWINEEKVFDIPKAIPTGEIMNQIFFDISHTNYPETAYAVYATNLKVATGRPDTRHKLIEEGKFSTTGILFDFQSAVIKPESYGVIKEIAGVMKDNAGVKIKVIGHTSSDGDDKANMELSQRRSAAVKDVLVSEFGIDAARLQTEGKGETQPIADNKTKEGKTANRRVEFIKL